MTRHWTAHLDVLETLIAEPQFGIISDFDGTLSDFVTQPDTAAINPGIAATFDALAENVAVIALVSGRGAGDLRGRFERTWTVYYGNHGIDYWRDGAVQVALESQGWIEPLRQLIEAVGETGIPGVYFENKGVTASVHYRLADNPPAARVALLAALEPLAEQYGFLLSEGRMIWEIKPPLQLNKGTASEAIVKDYGLKSVLFLGDDVTDFAAMQRLHTLAQESGGALSALSVGVVYPASPPEIYEYCDITANGVQDVEALLKWLQGKRLSPPPQSKD